MDWFLYDNGPRHERVKQNGYLLVDGNVNPFKPSVAFHIETSHLIFRAKQMTVST